MAIVIALYYIQEYNSTPLLNVVLQKHHDLRGNDWVRETFGQLFRDYRVDNVLGLVLLHHHFVLHPGEFIH